MELTWDPLYKTVQKLLNRLAKVRSGMAEKLTSQVCLFSLISLLPLCSLCYSPSGLQLFLPNLKFPSPSGPLCTAWDVLSCIALHPGDASSPSDLGFTSTFSGKTSLILQKKSVSSLLPLCSLYSSGIVYIMFDIGEHDHFHTIT